MNIREPAVAGTFYPEEGVEIENLIKKIHHLESPVINTGLADKRIIGAIVPHAGYIYSGYEAIHVFEILHLSPQVFDTVVILNPNHHGYGPSMATDESNQWRTPLGMVTVDHKMADLMNIPKAAESHRFEHSGEVMIPFLQVFLNKDFKILPISMLRQDPEQAERLAGKIARANQILEKNILILASSDFSHFVSPEKGEKTDRKVIDAILTMNPDSVYDEIQRTRASVCGYGPIMTLIHYVNMNYEKPVCQLLKFGNSGKAGPSDRVVDYASFLFYT